MFLIVQNEDVNTNLPKALAVLSLNNMYKFPIPLWVNKPFYSCFFFFLPTPLTVKSRSSLDLDLLEFSARTPTGCDFIEFGTLSCFHFQNSEELFHWCLFPGEWGAPRSSQWNVLKPVVHKKVCSAEAFQSEVLGKGDAGRLRAKETFHQRELK